jgi:4-diphosphocytidyl-2-C-methyl-D-erythritol kinase
MRSFVTEHAKAKINLALHVTARRDDGYHLLDSVVGFADCGDSLRFEPADETRLEVSGPFGADVPLDDGNIVLKAAGALVCAFAANGISSQPARIMLEKNLPVASGIGGGSADAAATLRGLCRLADVTLPEHVMLKLALSLGADVPVCLAQQMCRMEGIGEIITPLQREGSAAIVLVNPLVSLSTKAVFEKLGLQPGQTYSPVLNLNDPRSWRNDLQEPALALCPAIGEVLQSLHQCTEFISTGMSGSGATCFGLMDDITAAEVVAARLTHMHPCWWVKAALLG